MGCSSGHAAVDSAWSKDDRATQVAQEVCCCPAATPARPGVSSAGRGAWRRHDGGGPSRDTPSLPPSRKTKRSKSPRSWVYQPRSSGTRDLDPAYRPTLSDGVNRRLTVADLPESPGHQNHAGLILASQRRSIL